MEVTLGQWDYEMWQKRFFNNQRRIEIYLDSIKKYKVKNNPSYRKIHDEELGKLFLYIELEIHESLVSKDKFLTYLRRLYDENPEYSNEAFNEAFNEASVISSWKKEIKKLIEDIG